MSLSRQCARRWAGRDVICMLSKNETPAGLGKARGEGGGELREKESPAGKGKQTAWSLEGSLGRHQVRLVHMCVRLRKGHCKTAQGLC